MAKYLVSVAYFTFGLFLSVLVAYRSAIANYSQALLFGPSESNQPAVSDIPGNIPEEPKVETLRLGVVRDQRQRLSQSASSDEKSEVLAAALETGTLESLQVIREEYLREIPTYESELLDELKNQSLRSLLSRFQESDWSDWPNASFSSGGGPSQARLFIDDVTTVNQTLGRYLETGAQLFHGLYLKTIQGKKYDVTSDLQYVLMNAEELLYYRKSPAAPARELFDETITQDRSFALVLENVRGQLIAMHTRNHPEDLKNNLLLLESVQPGLCGPEAARAVVDLLRRLSLDATPAFRAEILNQRILRNVFGDFALRNDEVRVSLANLFLVCSLDALERKQPDLAREYLAQSRSLQVNTEAQAQLQQLLFPTQTEQVPTTVAEPRKRIFEEQAAATDNVLVEEGAGISVLFVVLLLFLVFAASFVVFLAVRARLRSARSANKVVQEPSVVEPAEPIAQITPAKRTHAEGGPALRVAVSNRR